MTKDLINTHKDDDKLKRIAEFFKVLGDGGRLSILYTLANEELCVNGIAEKTGLSPSLVSHQLRVLRQSHLVKYERQGKKSIYKLDDEHVAEMIETAYGHLQHRGEI
ncbi:MAG: helix-turn-helix transcriptional regulator [Clostridiales bacterium]|nr:helix-turn-helix transcriptional regulator [Clostridiales bacterium]